MHNLKYATQANERHAVTVKTWQDDDNVWHYAMVIDGKTIDEGTLDHPVFDAEMN